MSTAAPPRPRQATVAAWLVVVGSVLLVLLAFDQVASLGSIEAQEAAEDIVSRPPGDGLGLTVDQVQSTLRVLCFIAAACGAAGLVLGLQARQRSRSARLALTLMAPVVVVAGLPTAGFAAALVAAATVMLWLQPTRAWFAGVDPPPLRPRAGAGTGTTGLEHPRGGATGHDVGVRGQASAQDDPVPAPHAAPHGAPHAAPHDAPHAAPHHAGHTAPLASPGTPSPGRRPATVTAAGIVTIVVSALTAAYLLVSLVLVASDRSDFEAEVEDQLAGMDAGDQFSAATFADVAVGMMVVFVVWALVAILLAVLTMRGSNVARIMLVVSAVLAGLCSLVGALVVVPLVVTAATVATVVLLFSGGAGAWFAARRRH